MVRHSARPCHRAVLPVEAQYRRAPMEKMIDDLPLFSHRPLSVDRWDPLHQALKAIEPERPNAPGRRTPFSMS
jgi:hypothetical protein